MTEDEKIKKERKEFYLIKDAYIIGYTYDKSTDNVYVTLASGKKITFHNPSDLILNKIRLVYGNTGAKLNKANKILSK